MRLERLSSLPKSHSLKPVEMDIEGAQSDPRAVILSLQAEEEIKKEEEREEEYQDLGRDFSLTAVKLVHDSGMKYGEHWIRTQRRLSCLSKFYLPHSVEVQTRRVGKRP